MSNQQHTPEPWFAKGKAIKRDYRDIGLTEDAGETIAAIMGGSTSGPRFVESDNECEANARRIVACVNACAGISTERLEKFLGAEANKSVITLTTDNIDLKKQRDELLAALARTRNMIRSNPDAAENCANDAIAAVEQPTAAPVADDDGWIEWKGGLCPVAEDSMVMVTYRDGEVGGPFHANQNTSWFDRDAGPAFWCNDRQANDIIAYRVVKGGAA